jgi:hypothetical protein
LEGEGIITKKRRFGSSNIYTLSLEKIEALARDRSGTTCRTVRHHMPDEAAQRAGRTTTEPETNQQTKNSGSQELPPTVKSEPEYIPAGDEFPPEPKNTPKNATGSPRTSAKARKPLSPAQTINLSFGRVIADLCILPIKGGVPSGECLLAAKELMAIDCPPEIPTDLLKTFGEGSKWYQQWPGKERGKLRPPTPREIVKYWPMLSGKKCAPKTTGGNKTQKERDEEILRQAANAGINLKG